MIVKIEIEGAPVTLGAGYSAPSTQSFEEPGASVKEPTRIELVSNNHFHIARVVEEFFQTNLGMENLPQTQKQIREVHDRDKTISSMKREAKEQERKSQDDREYRDSVAAQEKNRAERWLKAHNDIAKECKQLKDLLVIAANLIDVGDSLLAGTGKKRPRGHKANMNKIFDFARDKLGWEPN